MNPPRTNPATSRIPRSTPRKCNSNIHQRTLQPIRKQLTLWGFVPQEIRQQLPAPTLTPPPASSLSPAPSQDMGNIVNLLDSQQPGLILPIPAPTQEPVLSLQTSLVPARDNNSWGDIWSLNSTTQLFRVFSKNTGTLNPSHLDVRTITTELQNLGTSVFAALETNIHWDPATTHQIYTQCRQAASHAFLATSCSQEPSSDWHKPGGTLLRPLVCVQAELLLVGPILLWDDGHSSSLRAKKICDLLLFLRIGFATSNLMPHLTLPLVNKSACSKILARLIHNHVPFSCTI